MAEALNVGSLDVGLLGDAPALFMGALGAPIKVIGVSRQNLDGVAIVVPKNSPIKTVADLATRLRLGILMSLSRNVRARG